MILQNISLKPFNTFGIDVLAKEFTTFSNSGELGEILSSNKGKELFILGGGSNILLTKNVESLVLKNEISGIELLNKTDEHVFIQVGAGELWHNFVLFCVENNFGGIENLSLIPGNVGASPMQNIGAYGVEVKDVISEVEAYNIESGVLEVFSNEACQFGYRESVFKRELKGKYVITKVTFCLSTNPKINATYGAIESELLANKISNPSIKDISNAVIAIRQSKLPDPKILGNAGSFFKNPVVSNSIYEKIKNTNPTVPSYPIDANFVKIPAGWLIETAGWKGKTLGTHGVHKNQALVLVNYGNCTGKEIWDLSTAIKEDVLSKFDIDLEREVNVL